MTLAATPPEETTAGAATPEFERAAAKAESRRGFLLAGPAYLYLVIFFAIPLGIVFAYSFASRNRFGEAVFSEVGLDAYRRLAAARSCATSSSGRSGWHCSRRSSAWSSAIRSRTT